MAKLSDIFLNLLGDRVEGNNTPDNQPSMSKNFLGKIYNMTPFGMMDENRRRAGIDESQNQQERDTQRLTALANASKEMNFSSPSSAPVTAGMGEVTSNDPNSLSRSFSIPVPGMSGITMAPKNEDLYDSHLTPDGNGGFTITKIPKVKGGKTIVDRPVGGGGGSGSIKEKDWSDFENSINPGQFKNRTMSQNLAKKQSAEAVLALLNQSNGNPNILQSPEIAQSVAMLLQSNQGRTAQEQLDKLTPSSLKGDIMKQVAYFSNQPASLNQQAFFKSLSDTAIREGNLRKNQILEEQLSRLPNFEHLKKVNPERYARILSGHGVDLNQRDSTGAPLGQNLLGQGGNVSGSEREKFIQGAIGKGYSRLEAEGLASQNGLQ